MTKKTGESAVEQAVSVIKAKIRSGAFAPGQRLVAGDLIKVTGVSAGPVREAVRKLTGEGLIEIQPHRGAVVQELSRKDVEEIYQLREMIEGLGARLAATRIDQGQNRATLEAIMDKMSASYDGKDYSAYNEANHDLHDLIFSMGQNERLKKSAEQLFLPIYLLRYHSLLDADNVETSMAEHRLIAKAIFDGDPERAEKAMRRHVRTSGAAILEQLAEET